MRINRTEGDGVVMAAASKSKSSRRSFLLALRNVAVGYSVAGVSGFIYGERVEANWLAVRRLTLPVRNLPASAEGLRLVHLTDFHLRPITEIDLIQSAVALANSLKPDVTLLTGDYVTDRADDIHELAPVLGQLNAKHGVFSILGNHDLWTNAEVVTRALQRASLPVLRNAGAPLQIGRGLVHVAGLDDGWSGTPDLSRALANCPANTPAIVLMHEPDFADDLARDPRAALQLSGHSHGGQVRLPGLGALVLPPYGRKYDYGLYRVSEMWLYTNAGIGCAPPGLRLNCRPEVVEITLTGGE
jgi:hypothetical protein